MRSSDQRYFQAQRTKRESNQHLEVAEALSMTRQDRSLAPVLYATVRGSSPEFTHIMLACGRTATDFRRNFRRGIAHHNQIPLSEVVPIEALREARLDGFMAFRLNREQYRNVKLRAGKTRVQDAVIHDPQGQWWSLLLNYWLAGPSVEHLEYLNDLRSWGIALLNPDDAKHVRYVEDKVEERYYRSRARAGEPLTPRAQEIMQEALMKQWDFLVRSLDLYVRAQDVPAAKAQARLMLEEHLVVLEAYVSGSDVRLALADPDTSQRRCSDSRMYERVAVVAVKLMEQGLIDPAQFEKLT